MTKTSAIFFSCGQSLWILCGWSRYSDNLATVGGSAATKGAKSHLNAVIFMMHPNKDLQIAPTTILIYT
jgi:hypothetical protein